MKRVFHRRTYQGHRRKRSKFGNIRCTSILAELDGRTFDSMLERDRAQILVVDQRAGVIADLEFQVVVFLTRARHRCEIDFRYTVARDSENYEAPAGTVVYEDTKGFETDRWKDTKRLWGTYGPGPLVVTTDLGTKEVITPEKGTPNDN